MLSGGPRGQLQAVEGGVAKISARAPRSLPFLDPPFRNPASATERYDLGAGVSYKNNSWKSGPLYCMQDCEAFN